LSSNERKDSVATPIDDFYTLDVQSKRPSIDRGQGSEMPRVPARPTSNCSGRDNCSRLDVKRGSVSKSINERKDSVATSIDDFYMLDVKKGWVDTSSSNSFKLDVRRGSVAKSSSYERKFLVASSDDFYVLDVEMGLMESNSNFYRLDVKRGSVAKSSNFERIPSIDDALRPDARGRRSWLDEEPSAERCFASVICEAEAEDDEMHECE